MAKNSFTRLIQGFFRPQFLGSIASVVGIAGGLNSIFGGGGGYQSNQGGGAPVQYLPTGSGAADTSFQQALQQLMAQAGTTQGQIDPVFLQSFMQQMGINPSGLATSGAQAGQQYGQTAGLDQMLAQIMQGQGQGAMQQQQALLTAGNDPQKALYDQEKGKVIENVRAADSARGLAMSPYSVGNETDALDTFNTSWQQQMLQRMLQANQGANQTAQQAGADLSAASLFSGQVPGLTQQAGAAPIQGQVSAAQFPAQAASTYGTNMQAGNQDWTTIMSQIIPYLNFGMGATGNASKAFAENQTFGANQQTQGLTNLLGGLGAGKNADWGSSLSNLFGGGAGSLNYSGNFGGANAGNNSDLAALGGLEGYSW